MKCFQCGEEGHIICSCPEQTEDKNADGAGSGEVEDVVVENRHEPTESVIAPEEAGGDIESVSKKGNDEGLPFLFTHFQ